MMPQGPGKLVLCDWPSAAFRELFYMWETRTGSQKIQNEAKDSGFQMKQISAFKPVATSHGNMMARTMVIKYGQNKM